MSNHSNELPGSVRARAGFRVSCAEAGEARIKTAKRVFRTDKTIALTANFTEVFYHGAMSDVEGKGRLFPHLGSNWYRTCGLDSIEWVRPGNFGRAQWLQKSGISSFQEPSPLPPFLGLPAFHLQLPYVLFDACIS